MRQLISGICREHTKKFILRDQIKDEKVIIRGINRVIKAGLKPYQMQFYILVGFDSTPEEDMHRVLMLRDLGCRPYVMPYDKKDRYQRRFTRWVNHKGVFNSCSFEDYTG